MTAMPSGPIGVAVSGGGDSMALLILLAEWAVPRGIGLHAVTVDHGLRPESGDEAASVGAQCREMGIPHEALVWSGVARSGNLQDQARRARRSLIVDWSRRRGIGMVALGHTSDDQAETFLMRLARGSGVDGLAAMAPVIDIGGLTWIRPLLSVSRASLREVLHDRGIDWIDDPSNADNRFSRVRARAALEHLRQIGLGRERLVATAARMARARDTLELVAAAVAADCVSWGEFGEAAVNLPPLRAAPSEARMRVLANVLCRVSGAEYRPRELSLSTLCDQLVSDDVAAGVTLHGCVLRRYRSQILVRREPAAVSGRVPANVGLWDRKWLLDFTTERPPGSEIGALGPDGLDRISNWRNLGVPREVLLSIPALWNGNELLGGPLPGGPRFVGFELVNRAQ